MYKTISIAFSFFLVTSVWSQHSVSGTFAEHSGTEIRLKGFNGFTEQIFETTTIKEDGSFALSYPHNYTGMGAIEVKQQGSLLLILAHEEIKLHGSNIQDYQNIKITNSPENRYFDTYIQQQGIRNSKLEGWKWLRPFYASEGTTSVTYANIVKEIKQLEGEEAIFLNNIPKKNYAAYFLPLRKLIEDRPASVNRYVERVPQHIKDFNNYDLTSKNLWQSGLMKDFYEGHFIMLESIYGVNNYQPMYTSIDHIIAQLGNDEDKLLKVSEHIFKLFEKRSLFPAAEYLSQQMLDQNSCTVEGELERRFQQYKVMKEGNKAPDIVFENKENHVLRGFKKNEKSLYEINSKYKLVVFWASWCDHCKEEMPKLQSAYHKLQEKDVEVVAISLDKNKLAYLSEAATHTWYSYCDFNEWQSAPVLDYYVFATPSFYLLDENNIIQKKIKSVAQLESVVAYFIPEESDSK